MADRQLVDVQRRLKEFGLYTGAVDGIQGTYTTLAIIQFQTLNGVAPTGKYSDKLDSLLFPEGEELPEEVSTPASSIIRNGWPDDNTEDLRAFFGKEGTNIVTVDLPYKMRAAWNPNLVISRASVNRKCQAAFMDIWERTLVHYGLDGIHELELDISGGTYMDRPIRGGSRPSTHWFGIAWDVNPAKNPYRGRWVNAQLSKPEYAPFRSFVKDNGGVFLGEVADFDPMHIQFANRG